MLVCRLTSALTIKTLFDHKQKWRVMNSSPLHSISRCVKTRWVGRSGFAWTQTRTWWNVKIKRWFYIPVVPMIPTITMVLVGTIKFYFMSSLFILNTCQERKTKSDGKITNKTIRGWISGAVKQNQDTTQSINQLVSICTALRHNQRRLEAQTTDANKVQQLAVGRNRADPGSRGSKVICLWPVGVRKMRVCCITKNKDKVNWEKTLHSGFISTCWPAELRHGVCDARLLWDAHRSVQQGKHWWHQSVNNCKHFTTTELQANASQFVACGPAVFFIECGTKTLSFSIIA